MAKINLQKGSIFENGWGIVSKKVMLDKDISTTAKAIYGLFCTYGDASSGDKAYPSIKYICDVMDIHKDTFYKHLDQLIEKDYIRKHKHKEKGKFASNEYEIVLMPEKSPFPKSSDTVFSDTKNAETINTNSISTTHNKNKKTYMEPKRNSAAMRIFLDYYLHYMNEEHKAINKSILYKVQSLLDSIYSEIADKEKFKRQIQNFMLDYREKRPTLNIFLSVAGRYFNEDAHAAVMEFYCEGD